MDTIRRLIVRARLRLMLEQGLSALGWLVMAGAAVALAMLLVDHLLAVPIPLWSYGLLAAVLPAAATVIAWRRGPSPSTAAARLDERLALKDRLSTALFAEASGPHPFARQVVEDAERAARSVDLKKALPLRPGPVWGWVLPAAAALALLAVFLPGNLDLLGRRHHQQQQQTRQAQAQATREKIVKARVALKDQLDHDKADPDQADPAQIMKKLASLSDRDLSNPKMRQKTVARLSNVRDKLAQSKKNKEKQFRSLQNSMSRLDPGSHGPADRFADALRRGDFDAAQKELKQLARQIDEGKMSASDKKLLKQQLQNMQQQLRQVAKRAAAQKAQAQKNIQKQLRGQGLNQQQIQQLQRQGFNQQALRKALQKQYQQQGMTSSQAQQQARRQARQVRKQQQQAKQAGGQSQHTSGLQNSLGQMASSLGAQSGARSRQSGQRRSQHQSGRKQSGQQSRQGQAGQPGQGSSRFSQGAWQAGRQLSQMAQMQQQLQQMGMAQSQLSSAMQNMQGSGKGQRRGQSGRSSRGGGRGGRKAGRGVGGNPIGQAQQPWRHKTDIQGDITQGRGRVITSWNSNGQTVAGAPTVDFDKTVHAARENAEHAVTEDRVPRRYHQAIREYFNQLPQSPGAARNPPAAPR